MEFWFSEFHTPDVKHSIRVNKQLYSKQSDYQRIDIFETPEFGRVLYFLFSYYLYVYKVYFENVISILP